MGETKNNNQTLHPPHKQMTFGERAADKLTVIAGSWTFIISLLILLAIWVMINAYALGILHWDPYPFILLNLILSCLAAFQAPVILMSQNRQSIIDRRRFEYDYAVNRKAEHEVANMQKDLEDIKDLIWTVKQDYKLNVKTDKSVDHLKQHISDIKKTHTETTKHLEGIKKDLSHLKKGMK
ncbi:MAG: DUF1003 domain-containing protein [archaeon]